MRRFDGLGIGAGWTDWGGAACSKRAPKQKAPQLVQGFEAKTPEIQQVILEQVLQVLQGGVEPQKAMDEAQRLSTARVLRK